MIALYYYLVLLNALLFTAVAAVSYWKNRHQPIGIAAALMMLLMALWLAGFAQYYRPMEPELAVHWAKVTLTLGVMNTPLFVQFVFALAGKRNRLQGAIATACYGTALACVWLLWTDQLLEGVRPAPFMHHYVRYARKWYGFLIGHIVVWQWVATGMLIYYAMRAVGYRRTQLIYAGIAWVVVFLTGNCVIIPLEYDLYVPPVGFFIMPLNVLLVGYVMSKARLADFNVVIARVLLYTVTLMVVVGISVLALGIMMKIAPEFMTQQQAVFTVVLVTLIGLTLAIALPRLLPRAERIMQERMLSGRYGYQDTLAGLVKELSHLDNLDGLFQLTATTVHSQMQLSRVLILLQDALSGEYRLQAESGLPVDETTDGLMLRESSAIVRWLRTHTDALVREEVARTEPATVWAELDAELKRMKVAACIPMVLDRQVVGLICLGPKANDEMFFVSDLKVLETLATEVALAVKYRRMEEQIVRKNKLVELGTIAAGVAHEIRNPLASIRTFAQLLPDKFDDPEFKNEFSKLVQKDIERITKVVESMLAFARPAQVTVAEHSATDLVEEAILLVQSRLRGKRIELTRQFHEQPTLRVDRQQLLQVLVNLLSNAVDVLPENGKIRIATGTVGGNGTPKMAVIEVADNGPGIPAAVRNRVFDPFFTTKPEGTGLGLSISQKIVRDHGGIITVSSAEGIGTTFQVSLPVA